MMIVANFSDKSIKLIYSRLTFDPQIEIERECEVAGDTVSET